MRLLVLADIAELAWRHGVGQADVLLSCGDVADQVILEAAEAYKCSLVLAVKGNHDSNSVFPKPIVDIHLQAQEYDGIKFGGLNGSWRYKPRGYFLYSQAEAQEFLAAFPSVQIFLSHNSPQGIHDQNDAVHYGFEALNIYIGKAKPRLVIHGHQHVDMESHFNGTRIIGVYGYKLIDFKL